MSVVSATGLTVLDDADAVGAHLASMIVERIASTAASGGYAVIGCPAGRTPTTTYAALTTAVIERELDLSRTHFALMDEYVEPAGDGTFQWCAADAPHSCRGFAARHLPAANLHVPDARDPKAYDAILGALGGVDLFLLAAGATDGHVAFNPAGSDLSTRTRIIELAADTRRDNLKTFPHFASVDQVPRFGVSVGLGTIVEQSHEAVLVFVGDDKRTALARTLACDGFDSRWPASVIHACRSGRIVADAAAASAV